LSALFECVQEGIFRELRATSDRGEQGR
jgi:hypothetical protein